MSTTNLIEWPCSICPAEGSQPCTTPSGRIMAEPHAHRAWFAEYMAADRSDRPEYVGPEWRKARDRWIGAANLDSLRKALAFILKEHDRWERDFATGKLSSPPWTIEVIESERAEAYGHMAKIQRRIAATVAGAR